MTNIVMFSAGVNLVKYNCDDCHHDHQQLLFPVSHLNHEHSEGHCHINDHCNSNHTDHALLKIDDVPVLKKQDVKINVPVKKWFGETRYIYAPESHYQKIIRWFTAALDPPDILAATSALLL